jgi:hypothetical protein
MDNGRSGSDLLDSRNVILGSLGAFPLVLPARDKMQRKLQKPVRNASVNADDHVEEAQEADTEPGFNVEANVNGFAHSFPKRCHCTSAFN